MEVPIRHSILVAVVDDEDYDKVRRLKWVYHKGYAVTNVYGKSRVAMHLIVNGWPPVGLVTDHIDRDKLNNRKSNLRHVTNAQNLQNKHNVNQGSSNYLGVFLDKSKCKYRARIKKDKVVYHLGYFDFPRDAALAYNTKALELYGNTATLNLV